MRATEERGEQTDAQAMGTAVHLAVLEPHLFKDTVFRLPDVDARTKAGKASIEAVKATAREGDLLLKAEHFDAVTAMAASVLQDPTAGSLVDDADFYERTLTWKTMVNFQEVECKVRIDLGTDESWIGDLKTTRNLAGFDREIVKHGYYRQAAWYLEACKQNDMNPTGFYFLAVQNDPPFESQVFELDLDLIDCGIAEYERLLEKYATCQEHNDWPKYVPGIKTVSAPRWLLRETFGEIEA